jgi:hypothetical protein
VYYLYRYYEPSLQRWVNRDVLQEVGSFNLFLFCRNRAINRVDPFGLLDVGPSAPPTTTPTSPRIPGPGGPRWFPPDPPPGGGGGGGGGDRCAELEREMSALIAKINSQNIYDGGISAILELAVLSTEYEAKCVKRDPPCPLVRPQPPKIPWWRVAGQYCIFVAGRLAPFIVCPNQLPPDDPYHVY